MDKETTLSFRPIQENDQATLAQLWVRCELSTPYNDPHKKQLQIRGVFMLALRPN